ncbi:helix-turn-helix transcriptional regulator [Schinkia azotoformans]|uniref:Transcriptional regulator SinR n=1 Tax=Schinkia azotoformans LMG 9581 TaxID=1131731 RepID=K6D8W0_SCHAZ|nr:helix-turn-helix transcriptional regulator [Schinkia azotoformans]EKN68972.1 transcriptional regulator SinR [Schinkia azotoformans LMG 9581]MEC1638434.1 helix-turn-helix transcriptional regulator [Schinkia azotoformans]MEC1721291.1 helix-turn-helix transcriptional regulator [Schinkia azotoformans]MEC1946132.1 helix-turn-helix transcriptional regulator [Schinkia azotoformans]MED4351634.1 helix-turn-helix transcriptional regulator [Schinkia azotoformans]
MNGKKIRDLRMKKGMSLTELAKLSGISKSYLSFIERGKQTNPSIEVIEKISKALSVDLQSLLTSNKLQKQIDPQNLDKEVIQLAIEMSNSNIDKEKLRQLINLLK